MGLIRTFEFPLPEDYQGLVIVGNPTEDYERFDGLYSILNNLPRGIREHLIRGIVTNALENGLSQNELKVLNEAIIKDPNARGERINLHGYLERAIRNQETNGIPF